MDPINLLFKSIMNGEKAKYEKMIKSLNIQLTSDEKDLEGKVLLKTVMRKFLPAADALLEMLVLHLPSPVTAQKYRVATLYEGPEDDDVLLQSVIVIQMVHLCCISLKWFLHLIKDVSMLLVVFSLVQLKLVKKLELWVLTMFLVRRMI